MSFLNTKTPSRNVSDGERLVSTILGGAMAVYGLSRKSFGGIGLLVAGVGLVHRGVTGLCYVYKGLGINTADDSAAPSAVLAHNQGVKVEKSITINMPVSDLYAFWRDFENLPRFMTHVQNVHRSGDRITHWIVNAPAGTTVEWDAEVYNEIPNELIAWRSLEGSDVDHAGSVHFSLAPDGQGTEVRVVLNYLPPGGRLGAVVAKAFGEDPEKQIEEDLNRLKQILETNDIVTPAPQKTKLKSSAV